MRPHTDLRATGDTAYLAQPYLVGPFANGSFVNTTVLATALSIATHWRDPRYNASGSLADYGLEENMLECVPTYIHRVASCNAANSFMAKRYADVAEFVMGDAPLAAQLRADADGIAAAVLGELYVPGAAGGFFRALYPNGTAPEVRHVMDYVYVTLYLGVIPPAAAAAAAAADRNYIPAATAAEMASFAKRELLVPHWMRALSLNDSAAPFSNRSDHGPSGAYTGWPALTARSLGAGGDYAAARAFLEDTLFVAQLGAYGQAVEVRPPGDPYKPMDVTLYNEAVSISLADTVVQTLFGVQPPLVLPGLPAPAGAPLVDAAVARGFNGTLWGFVWQGKRVNVVSDAATGLTVVPA